MIYPDLYDVGMPYYGYQILYHLLNREAGIVADRAYAPGADFESELRRYPIPLYGLETKTPLNQFDILGFTLPHELTYTNILNILDISHVPINSDDRSDTDPVVIAGGGNAYNPEPMADFIDIFLIGDAEEIIMPLVMLIGKLRREKQPREVIFKRLLKGFEGLYIPRFYECKAQTSGIFIVAPAENAVPAVIKSLRVLQLKPEYFPDKPVMPVVETAQDRLVAEIMRGCTRGCRFCQAGMIYRPVRERLPEEIRRKIEKSLDLTGYEDVSLLSLSSSDYCGIGELIASISNYLDEHRVGLSLPSLRPDSFSESIAYVAQKTRKSGLTFAPEAGSERLRRVINKDISDNDLIEAIDIALKYGWRSIKLYFMLGLPTETDEDIDSIVQLIRSVLKRSRKQLSVNITLSTFIPKPLTPFQWEAQNPPVEIQRKLDLIKAGLRQCKRVKIMARDPYYSQVEGIIARGDRAIAKVIYDAWHEGAKFDSWREQFDRSAWDRAFEKNSLDIKKYIGSRDLKGKLAWEHIDPLVSREFLLKEREKAYLGQITVDCRERCIDCGVCNQGQLSMNLVVKKESVFAEPVETDNLGTTNELRYRLRYSRRNSARFISHLDTMHIFQQALRRAKLSLSFTQGFNRRPKISIGYPLPLGYSSQDEYLDIFLFKEAIDIVKRLNEALPAGIHIESAELIPLKSPSLFAQVNGFDYEIRVAGTLPLDFDERIGVLLALKELSVVRSRKNQMKSVNIRAFIQNIARETASTFQLSVALVGGHTARPDEVLPFLNLDGIPSICRRKTYFKPIL